MKYCPDCGHRIGKGDKFCPSCGKVLVSAKKKPEAKPEKKKHEKKKEKPEKKQEPEPEKKRRIRIEKAAYGYLAVISFFSFTLLNIIISERVTSMPTLLSGFLFVGGTISYFAWFGLSLYFMKDKETRVHGIILFIIWLLIGMKSVAYQSMPWYERIFK